MQHWEKRLEPPDVGCYQVLGENDVRRKQHANRVRSLSWHGGPLPPIFTLFVSSWFFLNQGQGLTKLCRIFTTKIHWQIRLMVEIFASLEKIRD